MDNKTLTTLAAYADANRLLRAQRNKLGVDLQRAEDVITAWMDYDEACHSDEWDEGDRLDKARRATEAYWESTR